MWIEGSSEQAYGVLGDAWQSGARARGCAPYEVPEARRQRVPLQLLAEVALLLFFRGRLRDQVAEPEHFARLERART